MAAKTSLLDLPVDIILLILPHLEVAEFLNFTASCSQLHDFTNEHIFWADATRTTFRVPNQPVVATDGARWHKLYKRLKTQSRAYGWGENSSNCLGQRIEDEHDTAAGIMRRQRQRHICWPEEIYRLNGVGIISDLQCGGWSTSALTSNGAIYICGVIDGQAGQRGTGQAIPLVYPAGFVQPRERHDPATAIKQYSHGRAHLLALSDSGAIWTWRDTARVSIKVRFINHDSLENVTKGRGVVKKVVAGWSKSAALIEGSGIVVWDPIGRPHDETDVADTALVLESAMVPMTNLTGAEAEQIGYVVNFVVLEAVIVFNTSTGKAFVSEITWTNNIQDLSYPVEISLPVETDRVSDVQGTFRNAALFTESGAVLTMHQDRLMEIRHGLPAAFTQIPALQHSQVIAVAFGDYHFHALHAPGYITSYGKEPQSCGALGLGGYASPEGRIRGIRHEGAQFPGMQRARGDGFLVPHAYQKGRRVWFEKEKREWIKFLTSGGVDAHEAAARMRMSIGSVDFRAQGELSEWIEQEGQDWEDKYRARREGDDDLPAYFALSVTAAGWHSAALILVNNELADRITHAVEVPEEERSPSVHAEQPSGTISGLAWTLYDIGQWFLGVGPYSASPSALRDSQPSNTSSTEQVALGASPRAGYKYVWAKDHFPRLRLSNGEEMPGTAPLNAWRFGEPQWRLEG